MSTPGAQLAEIQAAIRAISDRAEKVVARVGESMVATRPRPESWSVAECLTHLNLSAQAYFPIWRDAFREARAAGRKAERPYRMDFWGWTLAWFLEPPPKIRFPAPAPFQPVEIGPPGQVLPSFLSCQDSLLRILADAEGLPLDQIKIVSAFNSNLRYSTWSSFCVTAAHHRRHLWQAERAATALGK